MSTRQVFFFFFFCVCSLLLLVFWFKNAAEKVPGTFSLSVCVLGGMGATEGGVAEAQPLLA